MKHLFLALLGCLAFSIPFIHGMESGVKRQTITEQPAALPLAEELNVPQTLFRAAVKAGEAATVKELLDADDLIGDITLSDLYPCKMYSRLYKSVPLEASALHVAAESGHTAVANVLIGHKAAVDILDSRGMTPLMWAAQEGHIEMVELLIDAGADEARETPSGENTFWIAYISEPWEDNSNQEVVGYFVKRGWYCQYLLNHDYILEDATLVAQALAHGEPITWSANDVEQEEDCYTDGFYKSPVEYAKKGRLPSLKLLRKAYACDNITQGAQAAYKRIFTALCTFQRLNKNQEAHLKLPRAIQWQILCGTCLAENVLKGAAFVKKKHRRNYEYLMETIQKRCGKLFNVAQILAFFVKNAV